MLFLIKSSGSLVYWQYGYIFLKINIDNCSQRLKSGRKDSLCKIYRNMH